MSGTKCISLPLFEFDVEFDDVLKDYYRGFVSLVVDSNEAVYESWGDRRLRAVNLPMLGVRIGLDEAVIEAFSIDSGFYEAVVSKLPAIDHQALSSKYRTADRSRDEPNQIAVADDRLFYYGPDGVCVWLNEEWDTDQMQKERKSRKR